MATRTPVAQPEWAQSPEDAAFKNAHSIYQQLGIEWGSETAAGYFQALVARFVEHLTPDQVADLRYVLNQGKWSVGWKGAGRILEEELG